MVGAFRQGYSLSMEIATSSDAKPLFQTTLLLNSVAIAVSGSVERAVESAVPTVSHEPDQYFEQGLRG